MKEEMEDKILFYLAFAVLMITSILFFLGFLPIFYFEMIGWCVIFIIFFPGIVDVIVYVINNPINKYSVKSIELVETLFSGLLTATILSFFYDIGRKSLIYLFTVFFMLSWLYVKVNQIRKIESKRFEIKEWITSLLWTFVPAIGLGVLLANLSNSLVGIPYLFLVGIILVLIHLLRKFKKK